MNIKYFFITLWLLKIVSAQVSEVGLPYSYSNSIELTTPTIILPEVNVDSLLIADENERHAEFPKPPRFGTAIPVNLSINSNNFWTELENGDRIWSIKIISEGAKSLNFNFSVYILQPGSNLYIYNEDYSQILGAYTSNNNKIFQQFASAFIYDDSCIIEFYQMVGNNDQLELGSIVHRYTNEDRNCGDAAECNINVNCEDGLEEYDNFTFSEWDDVQRSVGMHLIDMNTRKCSGVLVNNTSGINEQYFLTASHCAFISHNYPDQWALDIENSLFKFNYESDNCENINCDNDIENFYNDDIYHGLIPISLNNTNDFALVKIEESISPESNVYYSGWTLSENPQSLIGIHHPRQDIKKISWSTEPYEIEESMSTLHPGYYWKFNWNFGTIQGGSSGSPLYNENQKLIGVCSGYTGSICTDETLIGYGTFSNAYFPETGGDNLKDWLNNENFNLTEINGRNWNEGCTDPTAYNYNEIATIDIDICLYCDNLEIISGDVNIDGSVNILDIVIIANCILSDNCDICFDLNGDQDLSILDIVILVNIILDN